MRATSCDLPFGCGILRPRTDWNHRARLLGGVRIEQVPSVGGESITEEQRLRQPRPVEVLLVPIVAGGAEIAHRKVRRVVAVEMRGVNLEGRFKGHPGPSGFRRQGLELYKASGVRAEPDCRSEEHTSELQSL